MREKVFYAITAHPGFRETRALKPAHPPDQGILKGNAQPTPQVGPKQAHTSSLKVGKLGALNRTRV